jgi:hypothetical protein
MREHVIVDAETGEVTRVPFTPEEEAAAEASSPPVPQVITNFQARAVLIAQGYFDDVNDFVAGLGDATATAAWEYANEVTRSGALVAAVRAALGLTDQQMDDLFIAAAGIEA